MADRALFIGWGIPVRGRETAAVKVFNDSVQYWTGLQQSGQIESFEVALLDPHGGDLGGFALLRGSREQLDAVHGTKEFQEIVTRANLIVENLGVVGANIGDALAAQMAMFQEQAAAMS